MEPKEARQAAKPAADDDEPRLVTGDARFEGQLVQVWVNLEGILVLPAGTLEHGPLDLSDNPHFQRAPHRYDAPYAARLAEHHAGRWIPYPYVANLRLRRPGLLRRRWRAKLEERSGAAVSFSWRGSRPHAMLLWAYVVASCGLERVDGLP